MSKHPPTWERRGDSKWRRREDGAQVWLVEDHWNACLSCNRMLKTKQDRPRRWKTAEAATLAVDKEYPPEFVWKRKSPKGWKFNAGGFTREDGWKVLPKRGSNVWQVFTPQGVGWQKTFETPEYSMSMVDKENPIEGSENDPTIAHLFDAFVKKHKVALELIPALHHDFRKLRQAVQDQHYDDLEGRARSVEKRVRAQLGVGDEKLSHEILDRAEQKLISVLNGKAHRNEWPGLGPFGPLSGLRTFEIAEAVQSLYAIAKLRLRIPTGSKAKKKRRS